jgi:glycosyltransferase involved in cell wall biosynthesis
LANIGFTPQLKTFKEIVAHYKQRFGYTEHYSHPSQVHANTKVSVVIPSFNEEPQETLTSLGLNDVNHDLVEVILVINHSENTNEKIKLKHREQARLYDNYKLKNGVEVKVIKAFDLPPKQAGVGLARKIGMDTALARFASIDHDGLIVCFDADSTVSDNYLQQLINAETQDINGLSIAFKHPLYNSLNQEDRFRIQSYELWLRYYIQALRFVGYPHAYHTIGSSMAVRCSAYAKIGGMNRRKAGEDFYFLHKLIPQGRFFDLTECSVWPSARVSDRVPFGTGRAMMEMKSGDKDFSQVYNAKIFIEIQKWWNHKEAIIAMQTEQWPSFVADAFAEYNWLEGLIALGKRSSSSTVFFRNFSFWFDGFKMLKLVHYARDHYYPNTLNVRVCKELLGTVGADTSAVLEELTYMDFNSPFTYF